MNKENMMTICLDNFDLDCTVGVAVGMFFELFAIMPNMIEKFGYEKSLEEYFEMLSGIQSDFERIKSFSWDSANDYEQQFLRRCQVVAMLGAHLQDIPLLLAGNGLVDCITSVGGVNVTEEVLDGSIPIEQFV